MKLKRDYKILIVEDEPALLELYKTKMDLEGFATFIANNGDIGFMMAKNNAPDVILLDILMPEVDGYSMLKKLKTDETTKKIPVIIFSNLSQKEEIEKGFKLGAEDYIIKTSVTPAKLVEKVKQFLMKHFK